MKESRKQQNLLLLLHCCIVFVTGDYEAKKSQFNRKIVLCLKTCNLVKKEETHVQMCRRK